MDKGKIYKIVNHINNKVYIGCTINSLDKRLCEHLYRCFNTDSNTKLYNSIRKYGTEHFSIELIEECELNQIYQIEMKYIEMYDSYENGLNSTKGGEGCLGYKHTNQIRKKISKILKNGKSHKNKSYDILYGKNCQTEKEKRRNSVKKYWENITNEEKEKRINNLKIKSRENAKHSIDFIRKIKKQIKEGYTSKEFKNDYPEIRINLYYELKSGRRWGDIN